MYVIFVSYIFLVSFFFFFILNLTPIGLRYWILYIYSILIPLKLRDLYAAKIQLSNTRVLAEMHCTFYERLEKRASPLFDQE